MELIPGQVRTVCGIIENTLFIRQVVIIFFFICVNILWAMYKSQTICTNIIWTLEELLRTASNYLRLSIIFLILNLLYMNSLSHSHIRFTKKFHCKLNIGYHKIRHSHCLVMHYMYIVRGGRGVMVIVVGNGHGDPNSNPGWDWLHFT